MGLVFFTYNTRTSTGAEKKVVKIFSFPVSILSHYGCLCVIYFIIYTGFFFIYHSCDYLLVCSHYNWSVLFLLFLLPIFLCLNLHFLFFFPLIYQQLRFVQVFYAGPISMLVTSLLRSTQLNRWKPLLPMLLILRQGTPMMKCGWMWANNTSWSFQCVCAVTLTLDCSQSLETVCQACTMSWSADGAMELVPSAIPSSAARGT